ncbi:hypothetical protein ACL9RI_09720 [Janthinobacterium sp. Mn2066]|uniref:hypothetical protein n=1 Tax=Janthinobacterium sp. Mn2066 TaxID=3395264 RepID=UPI003BE2E2CB
MRDELAELSELARAIADAQRTPAMLTGQAQQLRRLVERHSSLAIDATQHMTEGESILPSGSAISPVQAALCAREPLRSAAFIQGLAQAVTQRLRDDRPVRVLYAGCGPYALLALPLMALFSPRQLQFSIIEIHQEALVAARALIATLGFTGHVSDFICADAAAYRIPAGAAPDVIVSETMNTALGKEPQVAIMRTLAVQAPGAALVPAAVTVHLGQARRSPAEPCSDWGPVFTLDAASIRDWEQEKGSSLPGASIRLPEVLDQPPRLLTRIRVHGDIVLGDYDCSLNLPLALPGKPSLEPGSVLHFYYRLGSEPGLAFQLQ